MLVLNGLTQGTLPQICYSSTGMNWAGGIVINGNHGCSDHETVEFNLHRGVRKASIDG